MRICFISHQSQLEGAERSLLDLIRSLKSFGIWAGVAVTKSEGPLMAKLDEAGIPWAVTEAPWWTHSKGRPVYPAGPIFEEIIASSRRVADLALHWNVDLIYSNTAVTGVGALAASMLGKPHIWHIREAAGDTESYDFLMASADLESFIDRTSSHIIFNSIAVREEWCRGVINPVNSSVVYNSVDIPVKVEKAVGARSVDVVIPLHNDRFILRCLASLLKQRSASHGHIYVLDDMTTDPGLIDQVKAIADENATFVSYLRNSEHLGFVKTCNRGMQLSDNDVILLNSDTLVTENWLESLKDCAYHDKAIGTVTPVSNNASLVSLPDLYENNEIDDPDQFSEWVRSLASHDLRDLPTAHGYCIYIKREVINRAGLFDDETFGHGYGEENDYSLRLRRMGFRNVACCKSFVYHKGAQSFGQQKRERLINENLKIIKARYPEYSGLLKLYRQEDPFFDLREPLRKLLARPELGTTFKIAMVGTITRWKRQLDALIALKELIKRNHSVSLWICGPVKDIEYLNELHSFIRQNHLDTSTVFPGQLNNPAGILTFCDVSLVCSKFEPFGRVTLESMLCGTPVVGANGGATPELIEEGYNGHLFNPGDAVDLADKIESLIENPERRLQMGVDAKSWATDFNDPRKAGEQVFKIIQTSSSATVEKIEPENLLEGMLDKPEIT